jgi:hypothetical protein
VDGAAAWVGATAVCVFAGCVFAGCVFVAVGFVGLVVGCVCVVVACALATIAPTLPTEEAIGVVVVIGETLPVGVPFPHPTATPMMMSRRTSPPPAMAGTFRLPPRPPRGLVRLGT